MTKRSVTHVEVSLLTKRICMCAYIGDTKYYYNSNDKTNIYKEQAPNIYLLCSYPTAVAIYLKPIYSYMAVTSSVLQIQ